MYITDDITKDSELRRAAGESLPDFRRRLESIRLGQGPGIPIGQRLLVADVDRIMQGERAADEERRRSASDASADSGAGETTDTSDAEPELIVGSRFGVVAQDAEPELIHGRRGGRDAHAS